MNAIVRHFLLMSACLLLSSGFAQAQYTSIDVPGAYYTYPLGISGSNIVGYYGDNTGSHGFLYNGTTYTPLNVPECVKGFETKR